MANATVVERSSFEKALLAVPAYWPFEMARQICNRRTALFADWLEYVKVATQITFPPHPDWVTPNTIHRDFDTLWLRDFSAEDATDRDVPVIIDVAYAGHPSTIADYADGQSLVQTLKAAGCRRLYATDWKSATPAMKDYGIDKYLSDLNAAVDSVGGRAHLVGLCQGGWLAAMFAARFPEKACSLVLAGTPMDTHAGKGLIPSIGKHVPMAYFRSIVALGKGRLRGRFMLAGWKSMHPGVHYWGKYVDLADNIDNEDYVRRAKQFATWYEHTVDVPGRFYLEAVKQLFKENRLARGTFVALGEKISLKNIKVPVFLLAGADDDITIKEQVFAARDLLGTPRDQVVSEEAPGGHIGLFMGAETLETQWTRIGVWIQRCA